MCKEFTFHTETLGKGCSTNHATSDCYFYGGLSVHLWSLLEPKKNGAGLLITEILLRNPFWEASPSGMFVFTFQGGMLTLTHVWLAADRWNAPLLLSSKLAVNLQGNSTRPPACRASWEFRILSSTDILLLLQPEYCLSAAKASVWKHM